MRTSLTLPLTLCALACDYGNAAGDTGNGVTETVRPGVVDCTDNVCVLTGTYTEDLQLTPDNVYLLRGGVFIGDDENPTTMHIDAGVRIYGETSTDGMLVIRRHANIMAMGTAEAPIVMTSSKEPGLRARGDWGGLIINGRAPINSCASKQPTDCEAFGEGGAGYYGGDDSDDSSGVLNYLRIEFAGTLVSPDNELNGIAFQGVGAGTVIDYVQVHMNADDGIEFFGGTANAKHVVISGAGDDSLDWTDGWQGQGQFIIVQQHDDSGDNGIEADNNGDNNVAAPVSMPTLSNMTLLGSPDSESSDIGLLIREGTGVHVLNTVVKGFNESCIDIDNDATFANISGGDLSFSHTVVDCGTSFQVDEDDVTDVGAFFLSGEGNFVGAADVIDPYNLTEPNFAPSAPIQGGVAPEAEFFDAVDYLGAIGSDDWTVGWTDYPAN